MLMSFLLSACGVSKAEKQYAYKEGDQIPYEVVTEEQLPKHMRALYENSINNFKRIPFNKMVSRMLSFILVKERQADMGLKLLMCDTKREGDRLL